VSGPGPALDAFGRPTGYVRLLVAGGTKPPGSASPVYLSFDVYPLADFSFLNVS
jgi:hypothetical protein